MQRHYVTEASFEAWLSAHSRAWDYEERPDVEGALFSAEARLLRFIVPNVPNREYEAERFAEAVYHQCWFEATSGAEQMGDLPANVTAFTVNGFSASLDADKRNSVFPSGIAPDAKAVLSLAGLLYRGVVGC